MGEQTAIEWADSTANLWIGCTKLSPACDHCYAEDLMGVDGNRFKRVQWGPHGKRDYAKAGWGIIRKFQLAAERNGGVDPALGRRRRIFVNSLSDMFDNHPSIVWREDAFKLFERSPDVDILLVTKRPQNVAKMVPPHWLKDGGWPAHVWLMITVENQEEADRRIPVLVNIADIKYLCLSVEPLLGPVDLTDIAIGARKNGVRLNALTGEAKDDLGIRGYYPKISWVIVGGESGNDARPMHPDWVIALRDQCEAAKVPFLFKQWGEWIPAGQEREGVGDIKEFAYDHGSQLRFHKVGKKAAGRRLHGMTHDGVPA